MFWNQYLVFWACTTELKKLCLEYHQGCHFTLKNQEMPGVWQFRQKKPRKPGIFNNFYMLSSKILILHKNLSYRLILFVIIKIFLLNKHT